MSSHASNQAPHAAPNRATKQQRVQTHARRALEELDRARRAASQAAALAHLELSELHLAEVQALSATPEPPAAAPRLRLVRP